MSRDDSRRIAMPLVLVLLLLASIVVLRGAKAPSIFVALTAGL
jgi:hypothetical protein